MPVVPPRSGRRMMTTITSPKLAALGEHIWWSQTPLMMRFSLRSLVRGPRHTRRGQRARFSPLRKRMIKISRKTGTCRSKRRRGFRSGSAPWRREGLTIQRVARLLRLPTWLPMKQLKRGKAQQSQRTVQQHWRLVLCHRRSMKHLRLVHHVSRHARQHHRPQQQPRQIRCRPPQMPRLAQRRKQQRRAHRHPPQLLQLRPIQIAEVLKATNGFDFF
mmetsp:Transcript_65783/g.124428  ORF Transcript_65783/g.124428 Transcript_65783/m.124428 type:complete len:217 (+) Transcript_65783:344-994(+)